MSTDVENNLISVERCIQFTELAIEAPPDSPNPPATSWPAKGAIEFKNLTMRYREGLPLVLKGINCHIRPREKIGIVGRTGSGKSSLMLALFRIVEPTEGHIEIDGINIHNIGLEELRSKLAIIPQDPTLFTGTIRTNLDPFNKHTDNDIWNSIEAVELKDQVRNLDGSIDHPVSEYGENLSVGTRQLLCLARALLKRSNILVMDEATANVDYKNDALIQKAIRREFKNVTVLTIAHRINTIMDYDRVMVLDAGQIIEFDSPNELMKREESVFYSLAKQGGAKAREDAVSLLDV
jgi:ABC-type multidrug transport system fused ATPase/permease subunit